MTAAGIGHRYRPATRQAPIMRAQHDGAIGWQRENTNVPDGYDWPAYLAKLTSSRRNRITAATR